MMFSSEWLVLPVFENTLMLQFTGTWMPQRHLRPRESREEETVRAGKKSFQNYLIVSEFLEFFFFIPIIYFRLTLSFSKMRNVCLQCVCVCVCLCLRE